MLTRRLVCASFVTLLCLSSYAEPVAAMAEIQPVSPEKSKKLGVTVRTQPSANEDLMVIVEFKKQGEMKEFRWANVELARNGKRVIASAVQPREMEKDVVRFDLYMDPEAGKDTTITIFVYNRARTGIGYSLKLRDFLPKQ